MDLLLFNRHWKEGFTYPFPEQRELYPVLAKALDKKFILSLVGLRRTGKTTLLKQLINFLIQKGISRHNILLYSFDEPAELNVVLNEYFKSTSKDKDKEKLYFFLDEVQKLPDWQNKIKTYYDHYPNLKFIVSGSSSLFLRKKSESLAGRIQEFWLPPLSFREFLLFKGKKEFIHTPNIFAAELSRELELFAERQFIDILHEPEEFIQEYLSTLVRKIIFEDIPLVYPIEQPQVLLKIFNIIASNPGLLLDYHNLSSDLGVNEKTLSLYVYYLEQAFLLKKIYNYSPNQLTSEKRLKKVYPSASSFCQAETPKVMESLAVTQTNCQFFWRRTQEVDMVFIKQAKILPVEVKYTDSLKDKDFSGISKFRELFPAEKGIILTKNTEKKEGEIRIIPLWKWLLISN